MQTRRCHPTNQTDKGRGTQNHHGCFQGRVYVVCYGGIEQVKMDGPVNKKKAAHRCVRRQEIIDSLIGLFMSTGDLLGRPYDKVHFCWIIPNL